jgi:recyclin-1
MQEMVYDDTRWVQRLRSMGCWNEGEARARFEEGMRKKWEAQKARQGEEAKRVGVGVNGTGSVRKTSTTLFDAGIEEERQRRMVNTATSAAKPNLADGFETLSLSASPSTNHAAAAASSLQEPTAILAVLSRVKSIRGSARQEYGRIYSALAPFYYDLARSRSHNDPVIFRVYREPEQQAQMLSQLQIFAQSDWAQGWRQREEKLNTMIGIFENAVLREFEQGYEAWDIDGKMHRYAHVLHILNGGQAGVDLFVQKHPLFSDRSRLGNPMDCINQASSGTIALEPSREFFAALSKNVNEQAQTIERVFPPSTNVLQLFLEKIGEDIIGDYVTPLFDEAHERSVPSYLKAVSGIFEQSIQFAGSVTPIKGCDKDLGHNVVEIVAKVFEPHIDLYLQEELDYFKREAESHVSSWEKKLSDEDASTESFFMANVNRQADKKDFLSSFKKVVMMPVNVLPSIPLSSPFASKPSAAPLTLNDPNTLGPNSSITPAPSRPLTPSFNSFGANGERSTSPNPEGPTNELAAKAALMASRLEGIKSLFSIEVALTLVHSAKTSLERAAHFVRLGGQTGGEAREQCEMIFVVLLQILGTRHVKSGFDKAVDHLSQYNPREVGEHSQQGVAPLVIFLELVNVGDLISQMIDVFYEQQLAATQLTDKNDFLDPAVKAKKKFEQMLDERVAAGLNKGIDVLMDEVEYVCATVQQPTDYNPAAIPAGKSQDFDIGPTKCAEQVVEIVSSHTKMLTGSTDKNMLDVFNQEVGLRLFAALCKHLKRQRISVDGAIKLISDMNLYFGYIQKLKNQDLLQYFKALRELSQIYLIDPSHAKEMATIIADGERFYGIFRAEEVYEYAERRADWFQVKRGVERAMYGIGCGVM